MSDREPTANLDAAASAGEVASTAAQPLSRGTPPGYLVPFLQAATLAFLGLLLVGAVLLVAMKLQVSALGAGADPIDVLTAIVIVALASLGTPVHIGDVAFSVVPLGAVVALSFVVRWACRSSVPSAPPRRGLLVGAGSALLATASALIFRVRIDPDPVFAGAVGASLWSFIWISSLSALAFASRDQSLRSLFLARVARLKKGPSWLYEGVATAGIMLATASVLATAAGFLWAIVWLLRGGGPEALAAGGLIATLVFVLAFAPNLVVVALSLSLGAPVDVGAGVTIGGRVRGPLRELSVLDGLNGLLVAIPLTACMAAGYWARGNASDRSQMPRVLALAALVFGLALALLAWLAEARLGAQLTGGRGFGVIAPRPGAVFLLGSLWAAVGGSAGWIVADRRR